MTARSFELLQSLWWKKDVPLSWEGAHLSFAVAQELFSSHTVDSGSILLLRSLVPASMPESGDCVDFGCGYGVLGLAFKAVKPGWNVECIDRDALAVEFSAWNPHRLGLDAVSRGGLGVDDLSAPVDLLLWNVPGKAGTSVLQALTAQALDRLAVDGILALVVVHPLAKDLEQVATSRTDIEIAHESAGPEHTVFHMKRIAGDRIDLDGHAFDRGTFDRELTSVDTGLIEYEFLPVIGLPQYEGPDIPTVLMTDSIEGVARDRADSALCINPGQGHVPIYLRQRWPDVRLTLSDRDLLALRASSRAVGGQNLTRHFGASDIGVNDETFALVTASLPNQIRPPVMEHLLSRMLDVTASGSHIAVAGGSTEVSRFIALARKLPALKLRSREKKKGYSGAIFERK
jgi:16S rRNA G1207 methylase RsmC